MKVKIIYKFESLEDEINEFIKDKKVIDIKYNLYYSPLYEDEARSALVMYEEENHEI